jgi:hypothetical protein
MRATHQIAGGTKRGATIKLQKAAKILASQLPNVVQAKRAQNKASTQDPIINLIKRKRLMILLKR